jgi:hypothetical protein
MFRFKLKVGFDEWQQIFDYQQAIQAKHLC